MPLDLQSLSVKQRIEIAEMLSLRAESGETLDSMAQSTGLNHDQLRALFKQLPHPVKITPGPRKAGPRKPRRRPQESARNQQIVTMYLDSGKSFSEIAAELGIARQRVHYILRRALQKESEQGRDLQETYKDRSQTQRLRSYEKTRQRNARKQAR